MKPPAIEWREIDGTNAMYFVSSTGLVMSHRSGYPRLLNGGFDSGGYRQCWINGRFRRVSGLVAEAFIGPRPEGRQVCHNDGNKRNDSVENLRYGTPKENCADRRRHGTEVLGIKKALAKLNPADVKLIRKSRNIVSQRQLAKDYGVSANTIKQVQLGRIWKHI